MTAVQKLLRELDGLPLDLTNPKIFPLDGSPIGVVEVPITRRHRDGTSYTLSLSHMGGQNFDVHIMQQSPHHAGVRIAIGCSFSQLRREIRRCIEMVLSDCVRA